MYHAVHTGLQVVGRLRQDGVFVCAHLYLPLPHSKELSIHIYMCIVVESYSRSYRYTLFNAIPCVHLYMYYNILSTVLRSTVKYIHHERQMNVKG